jgi:excisionase family DNA binding protein
MPILIEGVEYLKASEAAELAGRKTDTVAKWCREKKIECIKDGSGRWLVKRSSLNDYIRGVTRRG